MPYQNKPRLLGWRVLMSENLWLSQFGQGDDSLTDNGASGCTDTVLQALVLGIRGVRVSHNDIRRKAGRGLSSRSTGLTAADVREVIAAYRLPYRVAFGLSGTEMLHKSANGPVMMAVRYGDWPNWAHWGGVMRPQPWARPTDRAGRNQFTGFFGAHMNLLLGYAAFLDDRGNATAYDAFVKEPNHGSPARPPRPAYDIVSTQQAKAAYDAYATKLGRTRYCVYPTKAVTIHSAVA